MRTIVFTLLAGSLLLLLPMLAGAVEQPAPVQAAGGSGIESSPNLFLSVPPETLLALQPGRPYKFLQPVKRRSGRYPNWANLRDETVAQGGFQPGASQSDSAGAMRIGISFMRARRPGEINPRWKPIRDSARVYCWVRLTEWKWRRDKGAGSELIPRTLRSQRVIFHTGPARGLDSTGVPGDYVRGALRGERKKLEPLRASNKLFPEIVALKLNIAMSELGKTPAGFGDLIFDRDLNFLDELTVREIAAKADTMMTRWRGYTQEQYDSLWSAISDINRAFVGPLDTLRWRAADSLFPRGTLIVRGQVDIAAVPFLRLPVPFVPTVMAATSSDVESDPVYGDEEITDDSEEDVLAPMTAELYQNYPNPFNPTTTIAFALSEPARVTIRVLDILGREVGSIMEAEELDEGSQAVLFDGSDLASGVYLYRITAEGLEAGSGRTLLTGKMVLMK